MCMRICVYGGCVCVWSSIYLVRTAWVSVRVYQYGECLCVCFFVCMCVCVCVCACVCVSPQWRCGCCALDFNLFLECIDPAVQVFDLSLSLSLSRSLFI